MLYLAALLALVAPTDGHASERFADGRLSACVVSFDTGAVAGSFEVRDTVPGVPVAMLDLRTLDGPPSLAYLLDGEMPNIRDAVTEAIPSNHGRSQFGFAIEGRTASIVARLTESGSVRIVYHQAGAAMPPIDVVLSAADTERTRQCVQTLLSASRA